MTPKSMGVPAASRLESLYGKLRSSLAGVGYICPGSVVKRYLPCGKLSCRCAMDPAKRHGPYYEWSRKSRGKTISVSLSRDQARFYREWVRNNRRLKKSLERMRAVSMRVAAYRARTAGWLLAAGLAGLVSLVSSCATLPRDPVPRAQENGSDPFFDERLAVVRTFAREELGPAWKSVHGRLTALWQRFKKAGER